jgi:transposase-like protein
MARQEEITLLEFQNRYGTDEACEEHLLKIRWAEGFKCPHCGHEEYGYHSTRHLYQCKGCGYQVSATAGTVMHGSKLPLRKWFWAIFLVSHDKRGVSAKGLERELSVSYPTAWLMLHKIRKAMGDRDSLYQLSGTVELDDAYFGGPKKGGKRGRGAEKTKVVVGVSVDGERKPGFVKMTVGEDVKSGTLVEFAQKNIAMGSMITSDAYSSYKKAFEGGGYEYEPKKFDPKTEPDHLRWLHTFVSNAKTFILGTYHGLDARHFQAYLDEFCFRANRRFFAGELFDRLVCACVSTSTVTYRQLVMQSCTETS